MEIMVCYGAAGAHECVCSLASEINIFHTVRLVGGL